MTDEICTIHLNQVSHVYNNSSTLFSPISYVFSTGITYGIQGPSGIGKTTLLMSIAGISNPSEGTIMYQHSNKAKSVITACVFQQPLLIDEFSIIENVMMGAWCMFSTALHRQAYELLAALRLENFANARPRNLSIGQQQRVCLARCLIKRPNFLIADEPTAALDPHARAALLDLLISFRKEYNMGLIIGSHDSYLLDQLQEIITLKKP